MVSSQIEKLTWASAREYFAQLNPNMFQLIESINPDDSYTLYKIRYPFGSIILNKGVFYIPNTDNSLAPICENNNKQLRDDLLYNLFSNPISMPISRCAEIYLEQSDMVIPYLKLEPGNILGSWGLLTSMEPNQLSYHPRSIWNMSAGMRSLFMLAKIGDKTFHKRLQQSYHLNTVAPKHLNQQWYVFKEIASQLDTDWHFEMLCFSKSWFQHQNDPKWQPLYYYLMKQAWLNSDYIRNQSFWNLIFSIIRKEKSLPPSSYINDIVKHLHGIACGFSLGFAPTLQDCEAPTQLLQDVYVNGPYKLDYSPILMSPHRLTEHRPVYFSMNHISALEFSEKSSKRASLIQDTINLHNTLKRFMEGIETSRLALQHTKFFHMLKNTRFDSFYDGETNIQDIHGIKCIFDEDTSFKQNLINNTKLSFPQRGNFTRSCIRITRIPTAPNTPQQATETSDSIDNKITST